MPAFSMTYVLIYIKAVLTCNSNIYFGWSTEEGKVWNCMQVNYSLLLNAFCVLDNRIWYILLGSNHPGWARGCFGHTLFHN